MAKNETSGNILQESTERLSEEGWPCAGALIEFKILKDDTRYIGRVIDHEFTPEVYWWVSTRICFDLEDGQYEQTFIPLDWVKAYRYLSLP